MNRIWVKVTEACDKRRLFKGCWLGDGTQAIGSATPCYSALTTGGVKGIVHYAGLARIGLAFFVIGCTSTLVRDSVQQIARKRAWVRVALGAPSPFIDVLTYGPVQRCNASQIRSIDPIHPSAR